MSIECKVYEGEIPSSRGKAEAGKLIDELLGMGVGDKRIVEFGAHGEDAQHQAINFRSRLWHGLRKRDQAHRQFKLVAKDGNVYVLRESLGTEGPREVRKGKKVA